MKATDKSAFLDVMNHLRICNFIEIDDDGSCCSNDISFRKSMFNHSNMYNPAKTFPKRRLSIDLSRSEGAFFIFP